MGTNLFSSLGVGGGGAAFTPAQLAGLLLWTKADQGTFQDTSLTTPAVADTDPVGGWQDQSGSGNHLTQATAGKRPLLKLAIQNNLPVVRFDGVSQFLQKAFTLTQPLTLAGVFRKRTAGDNQDILTGVTADTEVYYNPTTNQLRTYAGTNLDDTAATAGNWSVVEWVVNGMASQMRVNNGAWNSGSSGGNNFGGITLAAYIDGSTNSNRDWGELVVCSGVVTNSNLDLLRTYLNGRWGIF